MLTLLTIFSGLASPIEARSFFTARRTFGTMCLGGGFLLAKRALDFNRDANKVYDAYKRALNPRDAEKFFNRASDQDTKSQMSVGFSAVLFLSGLRLLLASGVDDDISKTNHKVKLDITGGISNQAMGISLNKFF